MGRTGRRRANKGKDQSFNLDKDEKTIALKKWLIQNGWVNETKLYLKFYPETGRGVTSTKSLAPGNILICVPLDLMITFDKVHNHMYPLFLNLKVKLKMQELLSIFLMVESKCKGSFWTTYINSLPVDLPNLPWLCSENELLLYPIRFREKCKVKLENFKESAERVKLILNSYKASIWDEALFKWSYVMVNTRSVYIEPAVCANEFDYNNVLLDEPCMALCPFLDMFNHNSKANTEAICVRENLSYLYKLKSHKKHSKYEQIFISYGAHNNETLLIEYGFFIEGNILDTVDFDLREVLNVLGGNLDRYKFKFIENHSITTDLYVTKNDLSFNLRAVLFILFSDEIKNLSASVFSANYPHRFADIFKESAISLLKYRVNTLQSEQTKFSSNVLQMSSSFMNFKDFEIYWDTFLNDLINDYSRR